MLGWVLGALVIYTGYKRDEESNDNSTRAS